MEMPKKQYDKTNKKYTILASKAVTLM